MNLPVSFRSICIASSLIMSGLVPELSAQPVDVVEPIRINGETMGTYYNVIVESPGTLSVDVLKEKVETALAEFNRQMSTWDSESEISKFNQHQSEKWFPVSRDFALNVEESLRIHKLSGGVFDPTVAPLIEAWGFGRKKEKRVPPPDEITAALRNVGLTGISVRTDPPALRKSNPKLTLNLSAIAPGFAIDLIAGILEQEGLESWLVDVGGEARAGKRKPNGQFWKIGVESPLGDIHRIVELENLGIATSGNYRNFFVIDGKRYSHVLDPVTGYPVPNPPASVTVLHKSNMTADAMATTLMALGIEKGMQLAEQEGLDVLFLDVDAQGKLIEVGRGVLSPESSSDQSSTTEPPNASRSAAVPQANPSPEQRSLLEQIAVPIGAALGIFLLSILGMSVGAIVKKKQLRGSCGGLAALSGEHGTSPCDVCSRPASECPDNKKTTEAESVRT